MHGPADTLTEGIAGMNPKEIAAYLRTARNVIANDLRPELKAPHLAAAASTVIMLLDRLTTTLATGDESASLRMGTWQSLANELHTLGIRTPEVAAPAATASGPWDRLAAQVAAVQSGIGRNGGFEQFTAKLANGDSAAEQWCAKAVAAFGDFAEAGEPHVPSSVAATPAVTATAAIDPAAALREKLSGYLLQRFPSLPTDPITRFVIAPGGHVKQSVLFTLRPNSDLPSRLVLRRDLALSITGTTVVDEFPIIQRTHALGLPVPKPLLLESDPEPLGGAFMIMTEVEDAEGAGTYFPEERRLAKRVVGPDFGREVAGVLARLHAGTAAKQGHSVDFTPEVRAHREQWAALPAAPYSLSMDLSYAWLLSHPLPPNRPRCLTHGDIGYHNFMVRNGHVAALLDWELSHEADPAEDLAQCRMMLLPDTMPWPEFVKEYVAAGGDPAACDERAVAYYCIWTYLKHGLMNGTLKHLYLKGERDDAVAAIVSAHYFVRLMQYQARALQIAVDAHRTPVT